MEAFEQAPPTSIREALYRISLGLPLPNGLLQQAFLDLRTVHARPARDSFLVGVMTGLMARGPVEDELVEILRAALSLDPVHAVAPQEDRGHRLLVVAGSGKKGIKTFNVSTTSAIVASVAGAAIVKVGSYATSSVMGSRDLTARLRLPESRTGGEALAAVGRLGFAFVPVEDVIPVLDEVYGGRFHVLNPFSFGLAGLASPVRGDILVFGLAHPKVDLMARVLRRLGVGNAVIVASESSGGYFADELGVGDRSLTCELRDGRIGPVLSYDVQSLPGIGHVQDARLDPPVSQEQALQWAVEALAGRGRELHVHLVAINAALLLIAAGIARDLADGCDQAMSVITSGQALAKVEELREEALCRQYT